jgi:methionyl aminopeptidase
MVVLKMKRVESCVKRGDLGTSIVHGGEAVRPGVTTKEIDTVIHEYITSQGRFPHFWYAFSRHACISVNNEVIHGIPGHR